MFYKSEYDPATKALIDTHPLEFACVLMDKFKDFPEYKFGYIEGIKDGQASRLNPVVFEDKYYMTSDGQRKCDSPYTLPRDYPQYSSFSLVESQLPECVDKKTVKQLEKKLSDFFNVAVSKSVVDKEGNAYSIKIINNADTSIGSNLIVDELRLYHKDKQIGYLKAKYTQNSIIKKLPPESYSNALFVDKATIDYSTLDDRFKNKGLGYVMYFHMAQHLNSKKIQFRSSTLQSGHAKRLWDGINRNWGNYIKNTKLAAQNCKFLEMTQDLSLYFEDNKPKIKSMKI